MTKERFSNENHGHIKSAGKKFQEILTDLNLAYKFLLSSVIFNYPVKTE